MCSQTRGSAQNPGSTIKPKITGKAASIKRLTEWVRQPESIKLYFGDMPFWRAECIRMTLFVGGITFDDVRGREGATKDDLMKEGKLTFGAVPVIEVDGKILSQTQAIASYCSKISGMQPVDAWDAAKVEEALNGCTDVTATIGATMQLPDEEKVPKRQELIAPDGRLTMQIGGLEKLLEQNNGRGWGGVASDNMTTADLAVWRLAGWISSGVIDGIPKEYIADNFPRIAALVTKVDAHPKVKEWKDKHASFYNKEVAKTDDA